MTLEKQNGAQPNSPTQRIREFLQTVPPFDILAFDEIDALSQQLEIAYYPKGKRILKRGDPSPEYLYIIQHGAARLSLTDEADQKVVVDVRGEGDYFGATSVLQQVAASYDIAADEDLIILMLPADSFRQLVATHPELQRFFSTSLARTIKAVRQSASFHQFPPMAPINVSLDFFLTGKCVADLMSKDVLTCRPDISIRDAARLMDRHRVSSIIVTGDDPVSMGVVTDNDLRSKVLAAGLDAGTAVSRIMNRPVIAIAPEAYAFDALLTMSRHGVRLLVVTQAERLVGIISEHDLQMETGSSPVQVIGEIERAETLDILIGLRHNIDRVAEMLLRQGGPVKQLMALVTELNDRLAMRILKLVEQQMEREGLGSPPTPYGWLALGSEGRKEQTLHTDQDNALFFSPAPGQNETECQKWFLNFSERVVEGLVQSGIPRCTGGVLASNAHWCKTDAHWLSQFLEWITEPNPDTLLMTSIIFDFRPIYSGTQFPYTLQDRLADSIRSNRLFLRYMAKVALTNRPPLGLLKQFVVEKSGEHKNKFDLKMRGVTPIVDAARVLSLDLGIKTRNTFDRLAEINRTGLIDDRFYSDLKEAYGFIVYLQISRHLDALAQDEAPNNFLDPVSLNSLQRKMLKESFAVVRRLQETIEFRFLTKRMQV